jgi:hypothetical protein
MLGDHLVVTSSLQNISAHGAFHQQYGGPEHETHSSKANGLRKNCYLHPDYLLGQLCRMGEEKGHLL